MANRDRDQTSAGDALALLRAGNRRFREGRPRSAARLFEGATAGAPQRPFAIVLGCSDSRTPVEILFDQGFGDLFVVRVAGHVVAPSIVGSIEFAAAQFGARLVVVMGHTQCGAVEATLRAVATGMGPESANIRSLTDRIGPYVAPLLGAAPSAAERGGGEPSAELVRAAVRANVRAAADHLRHGSRLLEELVLAGELEVVGAEYELETGTVLFLDELPP